jgi:hypothetical protein
VASRLFVETNISRDQRKQGVIPPHADLNAVNVGKRLPGKDKKTYVRTWVKNSPTLTHDNVAWFNELIWTRERDQRVNKWQCGVNMPENIFNPRRFPGEPP